LCKILKNSTKACKFLAISPFYVSNAYGSLIHSHSILKLFDRGVFPDEIWLLSYMYKNLQDRLKIGNSVSPRKIIVSLGIKLRAITSPTIYNNAAIMA